MIKISLYLNKSEVNKLDKTIEKIADINGIFKDNTNIFNPIFIVDNITITNVKKCNYIYIEEFSRYYFIEKIQTINNGMWEISCRVDVLYTFKEDIKKQSAVIKRQENKWNMYLQDSEMQVYQDPYNVVKTFPSGFTGSTIILTMAGGSQQ